VLTKTIQIGKWTHLYQIPTSEDILSKLSSIPFTDEVNAALVPHKGELIQLLTAPHSTHLEVLHNVIPAKKWLVDNAKPLENTLVPFVGTLSVVERAQIANWFETWVSRNEQLHTKWLGLLPIAHVHTLFITYRMTKDPDFNGHPESEVRQKAWEAQLTGTPTILKEIDIDKECLC